MEKYFHYASYIIYAQRKMITNIYFPQNRADYIRSFDYLYHICYLENVSYIERILYTAHI
jgi:hypothetical protein